MTPPREPGEYHYVSIQYTDSSSAMSCIEVEEAVSLYRERVREERSTSTTQHPSHLDELDGDFA